MKRPYENLIKKCVSPAKPRYVSYAFIARLSITIKPVLLVVIYGIRP